MGLQNVSLFDEVQSKPRELSEALTYQTGSSNILSDRVVADRRRAGPCSHRRECVPSL